jgi:hypothetical protein
VSAPNTVKNPATGLPAWTVDGTGNTIQTGSVTSGDGVVLATTAAPSNPATGALKVYSPDGESLYTVDATGKIDIISGGAGQGGTPAWLNVKDFGAKGDGATDDTAAIQQALNTVPVGGVVYFPNGIYEISSPLNIAVAGTTMLGDKSTQGYSAGGSNQTVIDALPGFTGAQMVLNAGVADFTMRNLTLHGTNTTGTTIGLNLTTAGYHILQNVLVARTAGDGIVASGINNLVMEQVGVYHAGVSSGTGNGFTVNVSDSWYTNCLAAGCATAGWNILKASNTTFTACRAEDGLGIGFTFHDASNIFGGISFNQCTTDLNNGEGLVLSNLSGNGVVQLNGCEFRRDGNAAGAGSTTLAGIHVTGCTLPVVIDGTTVTARQGDSGGADAPHFALKVDTSTYVSVNGGYYSTDATGTAFNWDSAGRFYIGPNILTATVSASTPTLVYNDPWSTSDGSRFTQSTTADSAMLVQSSTSGTSTNALLLSKMQISTGRALQTQTQSDTVGRFLLTVDGAHSWGPGGSTARDTTLSRTAAGVLTATGLTVTNLLTSNGGTSSAGSAPALTPAFANGTAAQLTDTTRDYMLYLQVGTAGTGFSLAIGPTSSPANTIVASSTPLAGGLYTFRLPAGWFVKWSGTTTTLTTQTAIGC